MSLPKVLMVNKYYPPHIGGVEFHVADLAEGLVSQGLAEVTVLVVGGDGSRVEEIRNGVRVIRLPRAFEYSSTPVAWSFGRELAALAERSDVVHFHFPYPWGEFVSLFTRIDVPIVVTYHTDIVRQKRLLALYKPLLRRFLDRADVLVASSPNLITHSAFLAPRRDKAIHVDFGLPVERYRETSESRQLAHSLRAPFGDDPVILFVGRFVYYKGVAVLVDALSRMSTRSARLVLIGKGPLESEILAQVSALGLEDRVTFLDNRPSKELAAWYAAADVLCLPSIERSEAFGLVQIEAHASGTPVVSTDLTTGVPYANLDRETGLVVPVGDADALAHALDELLTDHELRTTLGENARARAFEQFTIPRMCRRMREVYDDAIRAQRFTKGRSAR